MHTKNVQNIAKAAQKTQYQTHIIRPYVRKSPSPILFFQTNNKSRNSTLAQTGKISAVRCLFSSRAEVNTYQPEMSLSVPITLLSRGSELLPLFAPVSKTSPKSNSEFFKTRISNPLPHRAVGGLYTSISIEYC